MLSSDRHSQRTQQSHANREPYSHALHREPSAGQTDDAGSARMLFVLIRRATSMHRQSQQETDQEK
jgi:hypothetical protein